jgi:hypothetical protein
MEEMLDSALIADEAETLVDQKTRDRAASHTYSSDTRTPLPPSRRKDALRTDPGPDDPSCPSPGRRVRTVRTSRTLTGTGCATRAPSATHDRRDDPPQS